MNNETSEKLQFTAVKNLVKTHCVSTLGQQLVDKLEPTMNVAIAQQRLAETTEARAVLDAEQHVPFVGITNIEFLLDKLAKGMILEPTDLLAISDFLRGCRKMKSFMTEQTFFAPTLASYAESMTPLQSLEEEINHAIKGSRVDSGASRELKRIRQQIDTTELNVKERLERFLNNSANKTYIQEFFIAKKDDRYTVPIKASYKNQVAGTVVELSATGSTVFIEPQVITKLNVELAMLRSDEAMEEYQILATLSGMLIEQLQAIQINAELISQYDFAFAKGKYSRSVDGIAARLNAHGYIRFIEAKHPLLTNAVPLNFEIGDRYRGLIITGPNAGGKTIVLKTIGLLSMMTMAGLHISAAPTTEVSVFDAIFVDIGDNQSIENALSTFSSHVQNLAAILRQANHRTLVLFDEIGSGTEPHEGAALAISILEEFYHMGCIIVATTHYGEMKHYSEQHPDFMNAAMRFNADTLEPLYELLIGTSGDSNALWISKKMGIAEHILQRAKRYTNEQHYSLTTVDARKIRKRQVIATQQPTWYCDYVQGDRVKLLEHDAIGIVYEAMNKQHQVIVYYEGDMHTVHVKRLTLDIAAAELYPADYNMASLFTDFKTRKREHDIARGSKKALKELWKKH